jgi:macrolide transport system ATP-binding/permease protein
MTEIRRQRRAPLPIVAARQIEKVFYTGGEPVHVLKQVDLSIPAGQFVAIMGKSGSGKSTLLYLLGGLDRPSSGAIRVAGERLETLSSDDLAAFRRHTVGFVFQSYYLVPTLTALENVALPGVFAGMSRDEREARAAYLLARLHMSDRADHRPKQLSGGQQQRVAIARALFNNPPIIMADEPTGALDTEIGQDVLRLLRELATREHRTVIVVTHDPGIEQFADRVIHLRDGQVVADTMTSVRQRGKHDVA